MNSLKRQAQELKVGDRILFHTAVPIEELRNYVGAVDLGIFTAPSDVKSYYYSLPNKFFENIQSEIPIIFPNYPSVKQIVDIYQIGMTCNAEDLNEVKQRKKAIYN